MASQDCGVHVSLYPVAHMTIITRKVHADFYSPQSDRLTHFSWPTPVYLDLCCLLGIILELFLSHPLTPPLDILPPLSVGLSACLSVWRVVISPAHQLPSHLIPWECGSGPHADFQTQKLARTLWLALWLWPPRSKTFTVSTKTPHCKMTTQGLTQWLLLVVTTPYCPVTIPSDSFQIPSQQLL